MLGTRGATTIPIMRSGYSKRHFPQRAELDEHRRLVRQLRATRAEGVRGFIVSKVFVRHRASIPLKFHGQKMQTSALAGGRRGTCGTDRL